MARLARWGAVRAGTARGKSRVGIAPLAIVLLVALSGLVIALANGAGRGEQPGASGPSGGSSVSTDGVGPATSSASTTTSASTTSPAKAGSALAALATLDVKGRAPRTGYDRALFGQAWADVDRNGCDTRNDILRRDLTNPAVKAGTGGCLILSGTLKDPYTGIPIAFVRGQATSAEVQIDHVVALSDAWQKGAQQWSSETRRAFANDPLNLLAVDGPSNQRKSDGDAATWLPPDRAYRCAYVGRQIAVKATYRLWVTAAERAAVARVLDTCPGQPLAR